MRSGSRRLADHRRRPQWRRNATAPDSGRARTFSADDPFDVLTTSSPATGPAADILAGDPRIGGLVQHTLDRKKDD